MSVKIANANRVGMCMSRVFAAIAAAALCAGGGGLWAGPAAGANGQGPIIGAATQTRTNPSIFTLKFGYQTKPSPDSFGDAWLIGLNWDIGINRNLAFGFEIQPAYRSSELLGLHSFPIMGWLHLKVGENLGRFVPALKPLKLYAGAGAGGEMVMSMITLDEVTETEFKANFGIKLMFGAIVDLGGASLVLEYQMARIADAVLDPNFWRHHIFLGFNF
jgi:hypothetical protein